MLAPATLANQEVAGKAWFNSPGFPRALCSSEVGPLGGNRYEVTGELSIAGQGAQDGDPATFTAQGATGVTAFHLRRGDPTSAKAAGPSSILSPTMWARAFSQSPPLASN